ncbi:MAG TPA: SMC-Scp complex subunit ScpB [Candidatus Acidoferrales bacterium]|nr:SMC-Scp complex subunit ScpB [Candidatus Acidoferrales bacterium]
MENQPLNQDQASSGALPTAEAQPTPENTPVAEASDSQPSENTPAPQTAQTAEATQTTLPETESAVETNEKKAHTLNLLEAALYIAGRPLDINEMCQSVGSRSKKRVIGYAEILMEQYKARNSPMEILPLKDERYVLQVKAEFTPLIKKLVNRPLLSSGPLKTLSYIAYRQPITQKRVIEVRGQHAYGHVKMLKDMGLIMTERSGRSLALKTTDYFADYFGLTMDTSTLKKDLRKIFGEAIKEDAADRERREAEEEKQVMAETEESHKSGKPDKSASPPSWEGPNQP